MAHRRVVVALGSNLCGPARQVAGALARLAAWPGVTALQASRLYRTPPWGDVEQPAFVNAVAVFRHPGHPQAILQGLLAIEREAGRRRDGRRWGPRVLDLDLIDVDGACLSGPDLTLPHPRLRERAFVIVPLAELLPDGILADGTRIAALPGGIDAAGIHALD